jgi:hypothetical protein
MADRGGELMNVVDGPISPSGEGTLIDIDGYYRAYPCRLSRTVFLGKPSGASRPPLDSRPVHT